MRTSCLQDGCTCSCQVPVIYTDGACSGNGTHGAKAGYGVYWGKDHPNNIYGPLPEDEKNTNNRAEFTAAIVAIQQAISDELHGVIIRTDSELLIKTCDRYIQGWKKNNWINSNGQPVKNQGLIELIEHYRAHHIHVKFEHVRGHSGSRGNRIADMFARKGAKGEVFGDTGPYMNPKVRACPNSLWQCWRRHLEEQETSE